MVEVSGAEVRSPIILINGWAVSNSRVGLLLTHLFMFCCVLFSGGAGSSLLHSVRRRGLLVELHRAKQIWCESWLWWKVTHTREEGDMGLAALTLRLQSRSMKLMMLESKVMATFNSLKVKHMLWVRTSEGHYSNVKKDIGNNNSWCLFSTFIFLYHSKMILGGLSGKIWDRSQYSGEINFFSILKHGSWTVSYFWLQKERGQHPAEEINWKIIKDEDLWLCGETVACLFRTEIVKWIFNGETRTLRK